MSVEGVSDETLAALRLARTVGLGPLTFRRLIDRFGSAIAVIRGLDSGEIPRKGRSLALPSAAAARAEWADAHGYGATLLSLTDPSYPTALRAIEDPPPVLTLLGRGDLLTRPAVAIVGARNASSAGLRLAETLAADLGEAGCVVVSGLARGIDGAAHKGALKTGTIAVIAGGIDSIYPPDHADLYRAIGKQGLILAEDAIGRRAKGQDFPRRNRIVAGLSRVIVVVEAAERSGTLITARMGNEQGREIGAVPGSPLDPRSAGTNRLLRSGATLIRHAEDVLELLEQEHRAQPITLQELPSPYEAPQITEDLKERVRNLLSVTPTSRDVLLRETGLAPGTLVDCLLDLLLDGHIEEVGGGAYALSIGGTGGR